MFVTLSVTDNYGYLQEGIVVMRLNNLFFKKIMLAYHECPVGYRYRVEIASRGIRGLTPQEYNFDVPKGGSGLDSKADEMIGKVGVLELATTGYISLSEVTTVNGDVLLVSDDDNVFGQILECKDVVQLQRHIDYVCHFAAEKLIESPEVAVLNYSRLSKALKNVSVAYQWVQRNGSLCTFRVIDGDDKGVLSAFVSFRGMLEEYLNATVSKIGDNLYTIKVIMRGGYCFV